MIERLLVELEEALRYETITPQAAKTKTFTISAQSSAVAHPICFMEMTVSGSANEYDLAKFLEELFRNPSQLSTIRKAQQREYVKQRNLGTDLNKIYPMIEPRYELMDEIERKKFRNALLKYYNRHNKKF